MKINNYTLLIPTYNRSNSLHSLLNYLASFDARFDVVILDSSIDSVKSINAEFIYNLNSNFHHIMYNNNIDVFDKFHDGISRVETKYFSMCADDDVVIVDSIKQSVEFLESNRDYICVNGWYFDFIKLNSSVHIISKKYLRSSNLSELYLERLQYLLSDYEPLTYAVHHTSNALKIFSDSLKLKSILFKELYTTNASVIIGKCAKLPILYIGRNNRIDNKYSYYHPIEYLARNPGAFFKEYDDYKKLLLQHIYESHNYLINNPIMDILHLKYFAKYTRPEVIDYIITQNLTGKKDYDISMGAIDLFASINTSGFTTVIKKHQIFKNIKNYFFPSTLLSYHLRAASIYSIKDKIIKSETDSIDSYRFYSNFLNKMDDDENPIQSIARNMDIYYK